MKSFIFDFISVICEICGFSIGYRFDPSPQSSKTEKALGAYMN
jgi:hypothetical protein